MQVSITGGELTLRSDWLEIAGQVKKRRMTLTILTNGTLLGAEATEDVARLKPVLVAVSLYGANAVAHERVTGVRGSFDRSLRALVALRSAWHQVPTSLNAYANHTARIQGDRSTLRPSWAATTRSTQPSFRRLMATPIPPSLLCLPRSCSTSSLTSAFSRRAG